MLLSLLDGAASDVADPEPRFEAATPIEAMHARVLSAALHEDVMTVPGPGGCERCANHGASMTTALKIRMGDDVFEKAVPPSGPQQIWRRDQHAACSDLCVHGGNEHRDAVVGQHVQPDSLGSFDRLRTGAHFRDPIEFEQRSEVGSLRKSGIGHVSTGESSASLIHLRNSLVRRGDRRGSDAAGLLRLQRTGIEREPGDQDKRDEVHRIGLRRRRRPSRQASDRSCRTGVVRHAVVLLETTGDGKG